LPLQLRLGLIQRRAPRVFLSERVRAALQGIASTKKDGSTTSG
jgi:hypothetical protein